MNKTKDSLPNPPFEIFRYLSDNSLVKGVVDHIHFFGDGNTLLGIPVIVYDENSCQRPLTAQEAQSVPYAVDLCLTPEEAKNGRLKNLHRTLELYESCKERCIKNFLSEYEDVLLEMQKLKQQISELV